MPGIKAEGTGLLTQLERTASCAKQTVPVSILIPIKNEAANLPRCLSSVDWAHEIIVVDSYSTDGSQQIAASYGAKVVQFDFNGTWPKKKNWALDNISFANDWVFILDADEVLPPEARAEIATVVSNHTKDDQKVGYWINRKFFFMGKCLQHAYQPNWNLRLFRHKLGRYEQLSEVDTASGDNEVHEHVIVNGKTGILKAVMDHHAFPTVDVFIEKHNRYSNWEARVAWAPMASQKVAAFSGQPLEVKRKLKLLTRYLPFRPLLRFLYVYIIQRGFLDGLEGYYFARLHAVYEFLTIAKTYEVRKLSRDGHRR